MRSLCFTTINARIGESAQKQTLVTYPNCVAVAMRSDTKKGNKGKLSNPVSRVTIVYGSEYSHTHGTLIGTHVPSLGIQGQDEDHITVVVRGGHEFLPIHGHLSFVDLTPGILAHLQCA